VIGSVTELADWRLGMMLAAIRWMVGGACWECSW
jgi:hypothetical protein